MDTAILEGQHLLLVDDNEANRFVARVILESYSPFIDDAADGMAAILMAKQKNYTLILMDVQLNGMDGVETCIQMRERLKITVPIIALTASTNDLDRQRCLVAGMNDFIIKPYDDITLLQTVCKWLNKQPPPVAKVTVNTEGYKLFNLSMLKKISRGNTIFEQRMLIIFAEEIKTAIADLEKAQMPLDRSKAAHICHRIKVQLRNMYVTTAFNDVAVLEDIDSLFLTNYQTGLIIERLNGTLRNLLTELHEHNLIPWTYTYS